jgi:thiol-disulfide isomerase/thioredoxin
MDTKYIVGFVLAIAALVGIIAVVTNNNAGTVSSEYNTIALAQCLTEKGTKFYGAFWCPHCQATKRLFAEAKDQLPYVECSTPDTQGQLQICKDKNIEGYPTWEFADGSRLGGEQTLQSLARQAGCPLIKKDGTTEELGTSTPALSTSTPATASSTSQAMPLPS